MTLAVAAPPRLIHCASCGGILASLDSAGVLTIRADGLEDSFLATRVRLHCRKRVCRGSYWQRCGAVFELTGAPPMV